MNIPQSILCLREFCSYHPSNTILILFLGNFHTSPHKHVALKLGWPRSTSWKNTNEILGQPSLNVLAYLFTRWQPHSAPVLSSRVCGAAGGVCHLLRLQSPGQQPLRSLRTVSLFSVPPFVVGPPPPLWVTAILRNLDPSTDQGSWVHLPPSGLSL